MLPERRCCERHPIGVQVQIRYGRRRFCSAYGRNLSVAGIWVEVHALTLPVGTLVELEFEVQGQPCLVSARVVQSETTGIGMVFAKPQPGLVANLAQVADLPPAFPQTIRPTLSLHRDGH
jgi:hypothetical protein